MERPLGLNYRLITANILGVRKFRTFTVPLLFTGWRKVFEEDDRGRVDSMLYNGDGKIYF